MEWPKLKNIIILILLLANLFLVGMLIVQERGSARYQEQALHNATSVLEQNGITMERSAIPQQTDFSAQVLERDQESEQELVTALLGTCAFSDLGGGRYLYEGPLGQAEFRSNGNFNVTFFDGVQKLDPGQSQQMHAVDFLKRAGLSGTVSDCQTQGGETAVTLLQTWEGLPVYSCQITLIYQGDCLNAISGQRLMGTPRSAGGQDEVISVPTAMLRVLNGINDLNDICNAITSMKPGYLLTTAEGGIRLTPVWYVQTDTGTYSLNGLTGVLERAQYGVRAAQPREGT